MNKKYFLGEIQGPYTFSIPFFRLILARNPEEARLKLLEYVRTSYSLDNRDDYSIAIHEAIK